MQVVAGNMYVGYCDTDLANFITKADNRCTITILHVCYVQLSLP